MLRQVMMPTKITQFQVDLERLAAYSYDIAADWVFNPESEMYKKYRNLRKDDFINLIAKDGDEALLTKRALIPLGVALVDRGNSSELVTLVMDYDNTIIPAEEVFGYLGVDLTREQVVDAIMDIWNKK